MRCGPRSLTAEALAARRLNFSFVLHEPSTSARVRGYAVQSFEAGLRLPASPQSLVILGLEELAAKSPDVIYTAHLGVPSVLSHCAARLRIKAVVALDVPVHRDRQQEFFRAPSRVTFPVGAAEEALVAAAVLRPGKRSVDIVTTDTFQSPDSGALALQALERIIARHLDQWRPPEMLWDAPAELLLPEVLDSV